jgi:hypothetical protein
MVKGRETVIHISLAWVMPIRETEGGRDMVCLQIRRVRWGYMESFAPS